METVSICNISIRAKLIMKASRSPLPIIQVHTSFLMDHEGRPRRLTVAQELYLGMDYSVSYTCSIAHPHTRPRPTKA